MTAARETDGRIVPTELLEALAAEAPADATPGAPGASVNGSAGKHAANGHASGGEYKSRLLVDKWLKARGADYRVKATTADGNRTVYLLKSCPFNSAHGPDAETCVMQASDGKMSALCMHDSCKGLGWQQFKEKIGKPDGDHYDPPLKTTPRASGGRRTHTAVEAATGAGLALTDTGNAERIAYRHGHELRHCHPWKEWLGYDGRRWAVDDSGEIMRRATDTVRAIYAEAKECEDAKARAQIAKHAQDSESAKAVRAMIDLARSRWPIPILPRQMDADPWALNVLNGTLDLRSGELRDHRREDLITKLAPVDYDPAAQCPLWMKFLRRIMADNEGLIRYLQRVVGYCLTGDVREQALWFLHGGGSNGKSTFLRVLLDMLGDYGYQAVAELLMEKKHASHPTERADLFGRRCVCTIETDEGKKMAEALMKQLTGGDKVTARKLFKDFFEFDPTHKILLAANHKPTIRGTDIAAWRRIKLVPFTVTISDAEKDKTLPEKLKREQPGILAWAVAGCLDWQREGLDEPEEVRKATADYRAEQDTLAEFIAVCCVIRDYARVKAADLLESYVNWSGDKYMNPKMFSAAVQDHGYEAKREAKGVYYHGLDLLGEDTDEG